MSFSKARKKILAAILLALILILIGWLTYVSRLTERNDRACNSNAEQTSSDSPLQRILDDYRAERNVGLQATIISPDGNQWDGSAGFASRERECPVTREHHFGIGSVTKLYTAALVMRQVESGTISLDDSISKWIDLPDAEQITVRMLLNHTSGIPDYTSDAAFLLRYVGLPPLYWRRLIPECATRVCDSPRWGRAALASPTACIKNTVTWI